MRFLSSVLLILTTSHLANAYETPNYDCSTKSLPNVASAVNKETNARITEMVGLMPKGCREQDLLDNLEGALASSWMGNLETWATEADFQKCTVALKDSVYRDFSFTDAPVLRSVGMNPVLNINGVYIGVDKLSHFMTEGLSYYKKSLEMVEYVGSAPDTTLRGRILNKIGLGQTVQVRSRRPASLDAILKIGIQEENGNYGLSTTGVRSYGDMMANYQGFQFWKNLVRGPNPYFFCKNGKWAARRPFKWEEFVNAGFDESINCNEFKTAAMSAQVDRRSSQLRQTAGAKSGLVCPFSASKCAQLVDTIKPALVAQTVISPRCREAASRTGPSPQKPQTKTNSSKGALK